MRQKRPGTGSYVKMHLHPVTLAFRKDQDELESRFLDDYFITALPIIAMTAHALESYKKQCVAAGMDGFITKPFQNEELEQMLNEQFDGAGASSEFLSEEKQDNSPPPDLISA